jgi:hypothetical protein
MTTIEQANGSFGEAGLLDRERIIATAGFNRWLRSSGGSLRVLVAAVTSDRWPAA